jgi:hypothetical protein
MIVRLSYSCLLVCTCTCSLTIPPSSPTFSLSLSLSHFQRGIWAYHGSSFAFDQAKWTYNASRHTGRNPAPLFSIFHLYYIIFNPPPAHAWKTSPGSCKPSMRLSCSAKHQFSLEEGDLLEVPAKRRGSPRPASQNVAVLSAFLPPPHFPGQPRDAGHHKQEGPDDERACPQHD